MNSNPNKPENADDKDGIKAADEYKEGWDSTNWDIVNDSQPNVSKQNHVNGHPLTGGDDKNEIKDDDDSGSIQRGLGGTTADNRGNSPQP